MSTEHLIEQYGMPDTYVSELAEVEDLGDGNFRFVFVARQHYGDGEQMVIVAKLVAALDTIPPAVVMTAKAVGMSLIDFPRGRTN